MGKWADFLIQTVIEGVSQNTKANSLNESYEFFTESIAIHEGNKSRAQKKKKN